MRFQGKIVLITGASSGIGAAAAHAFAREGAKVALLARRRDRLDALDKELAATGAESLALECDVTQRDSIDAAVQQTIAHFGGIDVVLANAGFGVGGAMWKLDTPDYRRQFDTNVFGVIDTVYACLPHLKKAQGRIGIVGSVMGHLGTAGYAPYCASKFAITGFAESIYFDLAQRGISVTLISPGAVESEIRSVNNQGVYTGKPDPSHKLFTMPADQAATRIVRAMHRRTPHVILTRHAKLGIFMKRHFPRTTRVLLRITARKRTHRMDRAKRSRDN